jgi:hypothetical protein
MNAPQELNAATAPLGTPMHGGFLIGRFFLEHQPFALIVAPKAAGEFPATMWSKSQKKVEGALSDFDGLHNTGAMAEAGNPLAQKIRALEIGGEVIWYLPSRGELLLAWSAREALPEAERFDEDVYWSSTQSAGSAAYAWSQSFNFGLQYDWHKDFKFMARAVRRVSI